MATMALTWAETVNDSAAHLGQCVGQDQVSEAEALARVELWSTILFKFRSYLDPGITKASCYDEVFESYAAGRLSETTSNCEEFRSRAPSFDHGHDQSPVFVFDTGEEWPNPQ
jgi:hypothetical protein